MSPPPLVSCLRHPAAHTEADKAAAINSLISTYLKTTPTLHTPYPSQRRRYDKVLSQAAGELSFVLFLNKSSPVQIPKIWLREHQLEVAPVRDSPSSSLSCSVGLPFGLVYEATC